MVEERNKGKAGKGRGKRPGYKPALKTRPVASPEALLRPVLKYRVEGVGPGGEIQYLKIAGRPLAWTIRGANQLNIEVRGETVQDALRLAARSIEFTPITIVDLNEE